MTTIRVTYEDREGKKRTFHGPALTFLQTLRTQPGTLHRITELADGGKFNEFSDEPKPEKTD